MVLGLGDGAGGGEGGGVGGGGGWGLQQRHGRLSNDSEAISTVCNIYSIILLMFVPFVILCSVSMERNRRPVEGLQQS